MSGTGMKQAQQTMGGAKCREGEKPCGCNETGWGGTRRRYVAPRGRENAEGERTSEGANGELRLEQRAVCGDVLVILRRGVKARERIPVDELLFMGGRRCGCPKVGPPSHDGWRETT